MFCRNCGNKLDSGVKFCSRCGTKNEIQIVQQMSNNKKNNVDSLKDNNNPNFLLSNIIVFLLFIANMCLLFLGIIISLFKSLMESSVASGWFLIIIPVVAVMFVIPQFIGIILSGINLKIKNYIMLIFIFIVSVISLITTISSHSSSFADNNGILFWICLISSVALCIIILLKLIFKIKK